MQYDTHKIKCLLYTCDLETNISYICIWGGGVSINTLVEGGEVV